MAFFTNPNKRVTVTGADGLEVFGDYVADTTTDLDEEIDGDAVAAGSLCLVISTGEFYCMGSDGSWHNVSTPEGEDAADVTPSVQSTRGLTKAAVIEPEVSPITDLEVDEKGGEIEKTEER